MFLTGRPFATSDQRAAGLGWSAIATTITSLVGVPRSAFGEAYDRSSDLGIAVAEVLRDAGHAPPPELSPTLPEVAAAFAEIEQASGPARKSAVLHDLLARADPLTAKYIVKVLGGDLRIGLREGLVEAAIARAFDRPLDDVKWAGMLVGDVGPPRGARSRRRAGARPRSPSSIRSSSCSPRRPRTPPRSSPGSGPRSGSRTSTTASGPSSTSSVREVHLYSRDLHDVSSGYPEIVEAAAGLPWDGILDGEILAWRDGTVLPFIALQARLGRKTPSAAIQAEIPVIYVDVRRARARAG